MHRQVDGEERIHRGAANVDQTVPGAPAVPAEVQAPGGRRAHAAHRHQAEALGKDEHCKTEIGEEPIGGS